MASSLRTTSSGIPSSEKLFLEGRRGRGRGGGEEGEGRGEGEGSDTCTCTLCIGTCTWV